MPTTAPTIPDAITLHLHTYDAANLLLDLIKSLAYAGDVEDLTPFLLNPDELVRVASLGRSITAVAEAMTEDGAYWEALTNIIATPAEEPTACPQCATQETGAGLCPACDRIPY